jgi:hypothetical protein
MQSLPRLFLVLLPALILGATAAAQTPEWIWLGKPADNEVRYFVKVSL